VKKGASITEEDEPEDSKQQRIACEELEKNSQLEALKQKIGTDKDMVD
jgi:hypothetical protein